MTAKTVKQKTNKTAAKATPSKASAKTTSKGIVSVENARERAEEVFARLQSRTRELVDARESLVATVTDLIEEKGLKPSDVKVTLDGLLGRIRSNELWDDLSGSNTVASLTDYREELERQVEAVVTRILSKLNIATKADLEAIDKKFKAVNRKVNDMNRKVKTLAA